MYSISIRYKVHFALIECFKEPEEPITTEIYKLTDEILSELESTCFSLAKNPNVYLFGKMKDVMKTSDLASNELKIVKKIWALMQEKLKRLETKHNRSLYTIWTDDFIMFLIAEHVLIGNHFKLVENTNYVLALMQELLV